MKDPLIKKLTIVIEAASFKNIPADALKALHSFEKSIAATPELKLSFIANDCAEKTKNKRSQSISPEYWDYWEV